MPLVYARTHTTKTHIYVYTEAVKERAGLSYYRMSGENKLFCEEHLHSEINSQLIC